LVRVLICGKEKEPLQARFGQRCDEGEINRLPPADETRKLGRRKNVLDSCGKKEGQFRRRALSQ